ncbi:pH-response regulator protein palI/RIM9 [Emericellopsis cladophorae]|uniref:PH-response regulator protein palI/RIM9 n=1 Tax=Emericellopsis cladophorae TaxID=2686198 RepID=A0A9P9XUA9_9HYPO|nr:pH-response regulator protein palI/RIM9 [Emericellopsis cladophorae]KAI6777865.1 pH-response regulator protein palI/RIM9 [Emericellopsis cladophorae]
MRLRPSTPLSVVLAAAFALLLLSVLSAPIITSIPLGSFDGFTFGVLGYCKPDGSCTSLGIGYDTGKPLPAVRDTLSMVLILHPVAALLVLIMFILAVTSHFHAPSHSSRYLLASFVFTIITFLVCAAAFVVDVLLFMPHMAWGTYIVLASTIMVAISGVVTCMMRRSLISRKTRRKKIAENAEMSGENYYNREPPKPMGFTVAPAVSSSGANGGTDALPTFATFEQRKKDDQVSDEHIPLTQRSPSAGPQRSHPGDAATLSDSATRINAPVRSASRDRFGTPVNAPTDAYGVARGSSMEKAATAHQVEADMPPVVAVEAVAVMDLHHLIVEDMDQVLCEVAETRHRLVLVLLPGRRMSNGYTDPSAESSAQNLAGGYEGYQGNSAEAYNLPRAESPPPMSNDGRPGQAVEMDATSVPANPNQGYRPYNGQLRDNDSDVAGMVGLQQGRSPDRHDTYMSGSVYSSDEPQQFVPARQAWNDQGRSSPRTHSPLQAQPLPQHDQAEYYEDIDPRFAAPTQGPQQGFLHPHGNEPIYEDVHAQNSGARSPAESERSTFTSISQRGVNPQWNPAPPMPQHRGPPPHRQQQRRQDMILDNPDFQIPGPRSGGPSATAGGLHGAPGMIPGSAYPTGPL